LVGAGHPDAGHTTGDQSGPIHHGPDQQGAGAILSALVYLRLFVYFCLGFGPMGLAALATGRSAIASLLLAIPVGVAAVFLAQAFFRFQRQDTDSQLTSADLVGQTATVIVPLDDGTMGKVRILVGPVVTEQYALAARPGAAFKNGDQVMVSSVTDECVYVR
jgi:membrane protein implicated in regulation of membrane protease activity